MLVWDFENDERDVQPFRTVPPGAVFPLLDLDDKEVKERLGLETVPGQEGVREGLFGQAGFDEALNEEFPDAR